MADSIQASFKAEEASRKAFGERLRASIPPGMTISEFAGAIGASVSGLKQWLVGKSEPARKYLGPAASVANVSLVWLVTGEGEMRPGIGAPATSPPARGEAERDADLYGRVLEAISAVYKEVGWGKSLRDLGVEAARIADDLAADGLAPEDKPAAVKAAAAMLRRQLRDAANDPATAASRKLQA